MDGLKDKGNNRRTELTKWALGWASVGLLVRLKDGRTDVLICIDMQKPS